MPEFITHPTLKELVAAGSVASAVLVGQHGGFCVLVRYGTVERQLCGARGKIRLFASLDTAMPYLKKLGLAKFEIDATNFEPGLLRNPRPDRAEALRATRTKPRQAPLI